MEIDSSQNKFASQSALVDGRHGGKLEKRDIMPPPTLRIHILVR